MTSNSCRSSLRIWPQSSLREYCQSCFVHLAFSGTNKIFPQSFVFYTEFPDQRGEFRKLPDRRK